MSKLVLRVKQAWSSLVVIFGALTILAPTAHARMFACNKTNAEIRFSYAIAAPDCADPLAWNNYRLWGWWSLQPNQCVQVSDRDLKNVGFSFTAIQGSTHWGARFVDPFKVPNPIHTNLCLRQVYEACSVGVSCQTLYHFFISSGTTDKTVEIWPNNNYVTK